MHTLNSTTSHLHSKLLPEITNWHLFSAHLQTSNWNLCFYFLYMFRFEGIGAEVVLSNINNDAHTLK